MADTSTLMPKLSTKIEQGELLTAQQARDVKASILRLGYDNVKEAARDHESVSYPMLVQQLNRSRPVTEKYLPYFERWLEKGLG